MSRNIVVIGEGKTKIVKTNPNDPATVFPEDSEGDNDIDLADYYTLYYQYVGGLALTPGYNADFNADGLIDLADYYGLYYGYQNSPDPSNWYPN